MLPNQMSRSSIQRSPTPSVLVKNQMRMGPQRLQEPFGAEDEDGLSMLKKWGMQYLGIDPDNFRGVY